MSEKPQSIGTLLAAFHAKQWVAVYDRLRGNDLADRTSIAAKLRSLGQKEAFPPLRVKKVPDGKTDYQRFRGSRARPAASLLGRGQDHRSYEGARQ